MEGFAELHISKGLSQDECQMNSIMLIASNITVPGLLPLDFCKRGIIAVLLLALRKLRQKLT